MRKYNRRRSFFRHKAMKAQKLQKIATELIDSYKATQKTYASSPNKYPKAPRRKLLKDDRLRYNDYGVIKLARVINSTYDDIRLAIRPIRYITHQVELKPKQPIEIKTHLINQKLESTRFRSMSEYVKLLNQLEAV